MNGFEKRLPGADAEGLQSVAIETIQVNLTLRCNQQCRHCHLECSPQRREEMDWSIMELVLAAANRTQCRLVDLTGGAPELAGSFRRFVEALSLAGHDVQMRTNLTAMLEPGMETVAEFLADLKVKLVASMPCYLQENVDAQRGQGVYLRSIEVLQRLNALGYGMVQSGFQLNLVYNPPGALLPGDQAELEADYRRELRQRFGVEFSRLLTITNMPVGRFEVALRAADQRGQYMSLLSNSFNDETIEDLMCRRQVSVGWDGTLYDCDFNLALGLPVDHGAPDNIRQFDELALARRRIVTGDHCFGCTAGCGSSCRGALV